MFEYNRKIDDDALAALAALYPEVPREARESLMRPITPKGRYTGLDPEVCERIKRVGWKMPGTVEGLVRVALAHFHRSALSASYCKTSKKHPDFWRFLPAYCVYNLATRSSIGTQFAKPMTDYLEGLAVVFPIHVEDTRWQREPVTRGDIELHWHRRRVNLVGLVTVDGRGIHDRPRR